MPKFILEGIYLTSLPAVDKQHQSLVDRMNPLMDLIDKRAPADQQARALERLAEVTKAHFAWEEKEMRTVGYKDYETHKAGHERLLKQVLEMLADTKRGKQLELATNDFFTMWLASHIVGTDQRYVADLKKAGRGA